MAPFLAPHHRRQQLDRRNLVAVLGSAVAVVTSVQAGAAVVAIRTGRRDLADVVWGPGLAGVALSSAMVGRGDVVRRWALAVTTTAWAARLGRLIARRVGSSDEEDPRYTEFLDGDAAATVVAKVFVTQGLAQLLVSAPLQVAAASSLPRGRRRWLFPLGLALMVTGGVVEAVADHQKAGFMARDRDERPDVLDTGLWGWSRHPNYFGDSLVWDGAWVAAAATRPGGWTLPAPMAMSYLLIYATGAKRTEKHMQERPAYREYQRRVSFFFPWPPHHGIEPEESGTATP